MLHIGESAAVSCMTAIHGRLWCGLGCNAVIVNTTTLEVEVKSGAFNNSVETVSRFSNARIFSFPLDVVQL